MENSEIEVQTLIAGINDASELVSITTTTLEILEEDYPKSPEGLNALQTLKAQSILLLSQINKMIATVEDCESCKI